jgi:hypothetical protein
MGGLTNKEVIAALVKYPVERCIIRSDNKHWSVNVRFPSGRVYGFEWLAEDGISPVVEWAESQALHDEKVVEGMKKCEAARARHR